MDSQPPARPKMEPLWLLWIAASVILPALPWFFGKHIHANSDILVTFPVLALTIQLVASIALAKGMARQRHYHVLGTSKFALAIIGFTVVFMLASLAIGVCVWLAGCAATLTLKM